MHDMSHAIYRLAVHLESERTNLCFVEGEKEARLSKNTDSTLTALCETQARKF